MLDFNCFIRSVTQTPLKCLLREIHSLRALYYFLKRVVGLQYSKQCELVFCQSNLIFSAFLGAGNDFAAGKELPKHWCSIAYWEHNERIGPTYEGTSDVVNVFDWLPEPSGFCLADLNRRSDVSEGTKRVRSQIGYGLQLTREREEIWIYNRSNFSLFANGPTLTFSNVNIPGGKLRHNIVVHKVPPGCSLKVFDYKLTPQVCRAIDSEGVRCYHPESIRISFKKGWGSTTSSKKYCRPLVTSCPCWIEIHLFVSR